jgi:hypothetical protein
MNSCDWTDCSLEVGLFDGAPHTLLSAEGRKIFLLIKIGSSIYARTILNSAWQAPTH